MNEPKKGWRESDAGKFYEKNKVPILVCAAIVLALSFSGENTGGGGGGGGGGGASEPIPLVQGDSDSTTPNGGGSPSIDDWREEQKRRDIQHDKVIEVIREEQTCSNGKVIPASDSCPDE